MMSSLAPDAPRPGASCARGASLFPRHPRPGARAARRRGARSPASPPRPARRLLLSGLRPAPLRPERARELGRAEVRRGPGEGW